MRTESSIEIILRKFYNSSKLSGHLETIFQFSYIRIMLTSLLRAFILQKVKHELYIKICVCRGHAVGCSVAKAHLWGEEACIAFIISMEA